MAVKYSASFGVTSANEISFAPSVNNNVLKTQNNVQSALSDIDKRMKVRIPCSGTTAGVNEVYFVIPAEFDPDSTSYDLYIEFGSKTYGVAPITATIIDQQLNVTYRKLADDPISEYCVVISKI